MSDFQFVPAQKVQRPARIAVIGPSGCGKTYSALLLARGIVGEKGRIAVIDTEHASASLYAGLTPFDTLILKAPFTPARYAAAARAAVEAGFDALVVDSMSQEWNGEGGVLHMVEARKTQVRNDFAAWNGPSQEHEKMLETLVSLPTHIISTFQAKTDYAMTTDNGRTKVEKLGLGAVTRDGVEYRYDLVLEMTLDHKAVVTKSRMSAFADRVIERPGIAEGRAIAAWLSDGAPAPAPTTDGGGATGSAPVPSASTSMGVADPKQIDRVKALILAAKDTPENSDERGRLAQVHIYLASKGYENVTLKTVASLDPKELDEIEGLLIGADAVPA